MKKTKRKVESTWVRTTNNSGYSFKSNDKNSLTGRFTRFIFENGGASKSEFYKSMGKVYTSGNCSGFFSKVKEAKIVKRIGNRYYLGENYNAWLRGTLEVKQKQYNSHE